MKFNGLRCDGGHVPLSSPFQIFILGVFSSKVSSERRGEVFYLQEGSLYFTDPSADNRGG